MENDSNDFCHFVHFLIVEKYSNTTWPLDEFPTFALSGAYLLGRQTLSRLLANAEKTPIFPLEEVFIGLCAAGGDIKFVSNKRFVRFSIVLNYALMQRIIILTTANLVYIKKKLATNWKYVPLRILVLGVPLIQLMSDRPGNLLKQ